MIVTRSPTCGSPPNALVMLAIVFPSIGLAQCLCASVVFPSIAPAFPAAGACCISCRLPPTTGLVAQAPRVWWFHSRARSIGLGLRWLPPGRGISPCTVKPPSRTGSRGRHGLSAARSPLRNLSCVHPRATRPQTRRAGFEPASPGHARVSWTSLNDRPNHPSGPQRANRKNGNGTAGGELRRRIPRATVSRGTRQEECITRASRNRTRRSEATAASGVAQSRPPPRRWRSHTSPAAAAR